MGNQQLLEQDLTWIAQVKNNNSSQALKNIFLKYQPLVEKYGQLYHIPLFERDDWYQEAWLVCYQTCLIFNGHQGSKFGSFFKLRLQHRAANLLREQLAVKRQSNFKAVSMEFLAENDPEMKCLLNLSNSYANDSEINLFDYQKYVANLSPLELYSLKAWLGIASKTTNKYSERAVMRAAQRARIKLRQVASS